MDVREKLRELGATDQQLSAKVVDLIEEALAEMSDEEKSEVGTKTAIEIRNDLEMNLKLMRDTVKGLNNAVSRYKRAEEDGWKAVSEIREALRPFEDFLARHPDCHELDNSAKAILTYQGMLEATEEVFGELMSEGIAIASVRAASYGAWRVVMGEK